MGANIDWSDDLLKSATEWRKDWEIRDLCKGVENFRFWQTPILWADESIDWRKVVDEDAGQLSEEFKTAWHVWVEMWVREGIRADFYGVIHCITQSQLSRCGMPARYLIIELVLY
jgi:hypothetical protein